MRAPNCKELDLDPCSYSTASYAWQHARRMPASASRRSLACALSLGRGLRFVRATHGATQIWGLRTRKRSVSALTGLLGTILPFVLNNDFNFQSCAAANLFRDVSRRVLLFFSSCPSACAKPGRPPAWLSWSRISCLGLGSRHLLLACTL